MAGLEKRGSYTPKRVREQRAFRLVAVGGAAATVGVVGLVLALVGVIGTGIPLAGIVVAVICAVLFRRMTSA